MNKHRERRDTQSKSFKSGSYCTITCLVYCTCIPFYLPCILPNPVHVVCTLELMRFGKQFPKVITSKSVLFAREEIITHRELLEIITKQTRSNNANDREIESKSDPYHHKNVPGNKEMELNASCTSGLLHTEDAEKAKVFKSKKQTLCW